MFSCFPLFKSFLWFKNTDDLLKSSPIICWKTSHWNSKTIWSLDTQSSKVLANFMWKWSCPESEKSKIWTSQSAQYQFLTKRLQTDQLKSCILWIGLSIHGLSSWSWKSRSVVWIMMRTKTLGKSMKMVRFFILLWSFVIIIWNLFCIEEKFTKEGI